MPLPRAIATPFVKGPIILHNAARLLAFANTRVRPPKGLRASSTIVGYAQTGLKSGFTMLTPQFMNVTGGAMPLESLSPSGDDVDTDGGIVIETLSAGGEAVDMYMWINWGGADVGWMNGDFELVEGVTFAPGAGLWVQGTSGGAAIQSAGQVPTSDVLVQLKSGFTATGNSMPVSVALQDIVPEGEEIDVDGGIVIETLSAGGEAVDMYMWINWGGADIGWMNGDFEVVEGVTFAPGAGLWVQGTKSTEYLRIPAPEL